MCSDLFACDLVGRALVGASRRAPGVRGCVMSLVTISENVRDVLSVRFDVPSFLFPTMALRPLESFRIFPMFAVLLALSPALISVFLVSRRSLPLSIANELPGFGRFVLWWLFFSISPVLGS